MVGPKSKTFGQKSTYSKENTVFYEYNEVQKLIHYLKNKVGVVDFPNAQGLVMF